MTALLAGCFSRKSEWKAATYFDDANILRLCKAIQRDKLVEAKKLLDQVDVNAKGQGNMTLLAWALRHENLEVFEALLQKGADPNVKFLSDFGYPFEKDGSVVHVATRAPFEFFSLVMKHGGDPNLPGMKYLDSPLLTVIKLGGHRKLDRVQLLLDSGADVEYEGTLKESALRQAISWGGQYDVALKLLRGGADPMRYRTNSYQNAVHVAVREKRRAPTWSTKQAADYAELLREFKLKGCPIDEAKADVARWESWGPLSLDDLGKKGGQERQLARERQAKRQNK